MSRAKLSSLRDQFANSPDVQAQIAPYEHQAFAREWTQENPLLAAHALDAAASKYWLAKQPALLPASQALGLVGSDPTPPSLDQVASAYRGIGQGLGISPYSTGQ